MIKFDREILGREVRNIWQRWASLQPDPKPQGWLTSWEDLPEREKEVSRVIGEELAQVGLKSFSPKHLYLPSGVIIRVDAIRMLFLHDYLEKNPQMLSQFPDNFSNPSVVIVWQNGDAQLFSGKNAHVISQWFQAVSQ